MFSSRIEKFLDLLKIRIFDFKDCEVTGWYCKEECEYIT
jgi:hypothetical protein